MSTAAAEAPSLEAVPDPEPLEGDAQLVLFEGQPILAYRLSFSGNVVIGDPDLIEMLTLGQEITVKIGGYVSGRTHKLKRSKDASKPGAVSGHTLVIQTVAPIK
jgi:hypothetical protein